MEVEIVQQEMDKQRLVDSLDKFGGARILVVGDIILDQYIWGSVSRISPEAPVPVVDVRRETKMLGGAANVINNLVALGARPVLFGVVGEDQSGQEILSMLRKAGVSTDTIFVENGRRTSIKTRVIAHSQQVVRVDRESREPINGDLMTRILDSLEKLIPKSDVVLVSDYGKGLVSKDLIEGMRALTINSEVSVAVDPKIGNFPCYHGVDIITPNHEEAGHFCRFSIEDSERLLEAGKVILGELDCAAVLITQGKDGMTLFERDGSVTHIPAVAKEVYDVTGAGDTVIAALCLGMAAGLDLVSSALIANFAGGIVVGKVGTSVVTTEELKSAIMNYGSKSFT
ncbi:MAG: D-glycero-beta-D-manno-heptose-7-phosphate kinase [Deltaproteobacteria bacterium]|nr:D-glycero-beta-D-manno-heptose-7-phosphate kinase [Deltaproteobacteria bacterium]